MEAVNTYIAVVKCLHYMSVSSAFSANWFK